MKSKNMKRLGVLVLAGVLALALAAPAFAATNTTTAVTSTYAAIDLDVTVPATGTAQINPYGLPVDLKEGSTVNATIVNEQITTGAALTISNQSKVALAVSADVTGAPAAAPGAVVLVEDLSAVAEADAGKKNVAAKFEAFAAPGITATSTQAQKDAAFAALKSEDAALTAKVLATKQTAEGKLILRAGDNAGAAQDGSVAFIRLSGEVNKKPTAAWTTDDAFTATIAFSFEPAEYVGTVQLTAPATVANGKTADVTVTGLPSGVTVKYDTIKWTSSSTATVSVADGTTAPESGTTVALSAVKGTLTGVKTNNAAVTITLEFEGSDGIVYRGTAQVKCS